MGRKIENNCVGCEIPCCNCGRKHQEVVVCDECDEDNETIYDFEGEELCLSCIKSRLTEVNH